MKPIVNMYVKNIVKRETHTRELDKLGIGLNPGSQIASIIKDTYHIISLSLPQVL